MKNAAERIQFMNLHRDWLHMAFRAWERVKTHRFLAVMAFVVCTFMSQWQTLARDDK